MLLNGSPCLHTYTFTWITNYRLVSYGCISVTAEKNENQFNAFETCIVYMHCDVCTQIRHSCVCINERMSERQTCESFRSYTFFRFSKFKTITQRNVRYFKVIGVKLMKINLEDFCQLVVDRSQFFFRVTKIAFMIIMFVE